MALRALGVRGKLEPGGDLSMKKTASIALVIVLLTGASAARSDQRVAMRPLLLYLCDQAIANRFYVTFEQYAATPTRGAAPGISSTQIPDIAYNSIAGVVSYVRKEAPGVDIFVDSDNKSVIHVVDRRAESLLHYFMAEKLTDFSFTGTLTDLPTAIGKQLKDAIYCRNDQGGEVAVFDGMSSQVSIPKFSGSTRACLTLATLSGSKHYGRLWISAVSADRSGHVNQFTVLFCSSLS